MYRNVLSCREERVHLLLGEEGGGRGGKLREAVRGELDGAPALSGWSL